MDGYGYVSLVLIGYAFCCSSFATAFVLVVAVIVKIKHV